MTIERSHGKARPTLPRASDLRPTEPTANGTVPDRDQGGRAAPGNALARGRGWKRTIAKMLARDGAELPEASAAVAADAWRLFGPALRELPHDGPNVRSLVALKARHEALSGFWHARSLALGLDSPEGIAADERATEHGKRVERLTVTAGDVARVHALAAKLQPKVWAGWPGLQAPQPARPAQVSEGGQGVIEAGGSGVAGTPPNFSHTVASALSADDLAELNALSPADRARALRELAEEIEGDDAPAPHVERGQGDHLDHGTPSAVRHYEPPAPVRPLAREVMSLTGAAGVALPAHLMGAPLAPSPMHGGALMPVGQAAPIPQATPPADLQARIAEARARLTPRR